MQLTHERGARRLSPIAVLAHAFVKSWANGGNLPTEQADDKMAAFQRAVTSPLGVDASAAPLVRNIVLGYASQLPASAFAGLLALDPLVVNVDGLTTATVPARTDDMTGAGFVKPGDPMPILSATLSGAKLDAKKAAGGAIYTEELAKSSNGDVVINTLMSESVSVAVDAVLLSAAAPTDAAPAGILYQAAPAITGSTDMATDLRKMLAAIVRPLRPVWLMNASSLLAANAARLTDAQGRLAGAPVVVSPSMGDGEVILMDLADFVVGAGTDIDYSRVIEAAVHMADTALPIIAQDTVPAAMPSSPVSSLWQQNLVGVMAILPLSWAMRRPQRVAFLSGSTW